MVALVLAFLSTVVASAQQPNQPASKGAQTRPAGGGWLEGWRLSILSFGVLDRDAVRREYYRVVGTGIVFMIDPATAYIVTAKHVFFDPDKNWRPSEIRIRYGWQDQRSVYEEHGVAIQLRDTSGNDLWTALTDGSDIAAIRAPAPSMANQPALTLNIGANADEVFEGASVIVLGYPGIVGNEYLVRAITRGGIVAWLSPSGPLDNPFLVDANIYPGNSGGPVIKVPTGSNKEGGFVSGGRAVLLGIVSKAPGQFQDLELKVPGVLLPLKIHQEIPLGGTGIVEPVSKVTRLLDSLRSKK
jgi:S1-C subfamily serine protease